MGLMFVVSLGAWALSSPTGSSPDEDFHLAAIYCATGDWTCSETGPRVAPCYAFNVRITGDCIGGTPRPGLSKTPMDNLAVPTLTGITDNRPEVYSRFMSLFVGETVGDTARTVRLVNSLLAVLMAFASVALSARRFRSAVALGWVACSVPLAAFTLASANPSSWAIIGVVALWGPLLSFIADRSVRRDSIARAAFCLVAVLMAIGSRTEAPFLIAITVAGVLAFAIAENASSLRSWLPRLAVPAALAVLSVAVLLWVSRGRLASILALNPDAAQRREGVGPLDVLLYAIDSVITGVSQPALGWMDTPMPPLARFLATAVFGGCVVAGAGMMFRAKSWLVASLAVLLGAFALLSASRYPGLQPRYFLPLVMVLVAALLIARAPAIGVLTRTQGALVVISLVIANVMCLGTNLQRYVVGLQPGPWTVTLRGVDRPEWWANALPIGPFGLWLVGAAAFAIACALLLWLLPWRPTGREVREPRRNPAVDSSDPDGLRSSPQPSHP